MTPYEWAVGKRRTLLETLKAGGRPGDATFDAAAVDAALAKGSPREGAIRFAPDAAIVEVHVAFAGSAPVILPFRFLAPERIVWMAVPEWVVENVWQGEVTGRHLFESEAWAALDRVAAGLMPEPNAAAFPKG